MMDKKINIKIGTGTLDSMLFSTARYYIGRHTIHAHSGALEMATFLHENPDVMTKSRRHFFARDIREQINHTMNWAGNITIDGLQEYHKPDALVMLCRAVVSHIKRNNLHIVNGYNAKGAADEFNPADYDFHIDLNSDKVSIKRAQQPRTSSVGPADIGELVSDLTVWSKLAGWLDPVLKVSAKYGDTVITEEPGFEFPTIGRYEGEQHMHFEVNTVTVKHYIDNPWHDSYIAPECITAVTKMV